MFFFREVFAGLHFVNIFIFRCVLHVQHLSFSLICCCNNRLLGEYCRLWTSALCNFLHYYITFSLLDQNIISILLSNTLDERPGFTPAQNMSMHIRRDICKGGVPTLKYVNCTTWYCIWFHYERHMVSANICCLCTHSYCWWILLDQRTLFPNIHISPTCS